MIARGLGLITSSGFYVPQVNLLGSMATFVTPAGIPVVPVSAPARRGLGQDIPDCSGEFLSKWADGEGFEAARAAHSHSARSIECSRPNTTTEKLRPIRTREQSRAEPLPAAPPIIYQKVLFSARQKPPQSGAELRKENKAVNRCRGAVPKTSPFDNDHPIWRLVTLPGEPEVAISAITSALDD
jgi:hypothetical protein